MDDVVIIGGGIIGAATAYFLSKEGRKVKVIERDPTYKTASFPLSLGGFRRQFFQKENILLGKFAREFIFQIPELLKTEKNPDPTASMVTNGYLLMFGPEHAEEQYKALENHKACEAGTKNSPFIEMDCIYFFRLLKPGNKISVIIDQNDKDGKILYASQDGIKSDLTNVNLIKSYLKHPLMTFKIILAIHFEAFRIWTKGIKFINKKIKIKNNITIEN